MTTATSNPVPRRRFLRQTAGIAGTVACSCGSAAPAADAPVLRAGAAAVDITPKLYPVGMPGLFTARKAESAHDPLHARALVLDNGATALALAIVDNLQVPAEVIGEAKANAAKRCGLAVDKMLVASTHTHSGASCGGPGGSPEAEYRKLLVDGIAEAIVRAHAALRPASVGAGVESLPDQVANRRWFLRPGKMPPNPFGGMDQVKTNPVRSPDVIERPAGPTDPDLTILSVHDAKSDRPLALMANFTLHYVGRTPEGQLSADYFGEFARVVAQREGVEKDFTAMMFNGAEGDAISAPVAAPLQPFEKIRLVAGKVAEGAWRAHGTIAEHFGDARLGMVERSLILKRRRPTAEQIAWAKGVLALKDQAERDKLPPHAESYARRALRLANETETVTVPLQAVRIGDLALCGVPFEAFVEIGLELKKRSPFSRTMVIGLANGNYGYLPTPAQHKLGGYETWLGSCSVQEDASALLVDNLLEMLGELRKA